MKLTGKWMKLQKRSLILGCYHLIFIRASFTWNMHRGQETSKRRQSGDFQGRGTRTQWYTGLRGITIKH